ncbi:MAG TPA: GyrI-like domain-containing protein [Cyclobacteriaceae bacterium]|jgi:effector-binding domain-containing protein|nr:GyrI-like domain-containing protein [Cyclobacteriaceae bacterium]
MKNLQQTPVEKEIKPINFLYHRTEVKINDLIHQIPVAKELFKEAVRLDLHPTGPIHWHYIGFTGVGSKPFLLEICLPVASVPIDYDGSFHFKRTENFKSLSIMHEGAWNEIPKSYEILMKCVEQKDYQPIGINREVYINSDFSDPQANVTEIQIGIK